MCWWVSTHNRDSFKTLFHSLGSSFRTFQTVSRTNVFLSGMSRLKEEEPERISEMGNPILGQHSRLEVIVEESSEIKVCEEAKRKLLIIPYCIRYLSYVPVLLTTL